MKKYFAAAAAIAASLMFTINAYAGQWVSDGAAWKYQEDAGSYKTGWLQDGDKWYYLDSNGVMLADTVTPDGYQVGADGAWITAESAAPLHSEPLELKTLTPISSSNYSAFKNENAATWVWTKEKEKWFHSLTLSSWGPDEYDGYVEFPLDGTYTKLTGRVGPSVTMYGDLSGTLKIYGGDGKLLYQSGVIDSNHYEDISADISGQKSVRLYLEPTDGWGCYIVIKDLFAY